MRIYEGSPRQDWEEVLRAIGSMADHERLKELLFLELDQGFVLQGLALPDSGAWAESAGQLAKRTFELVDDEIGRLMDEAASRRGTASDPHPHLEISNYYEHALRVLGAWIDLQRPRDVFFFEQDGSFVVRLLGTGAAGGSHQLAEFTKDEIVAMIGDAPKQRKAASEAGARKS